jgi:hypothetical protein
MKRRFLGASRYWCRRAANGVGCRRLLLLLLGAGDE